MAGQNGGKINVDMPGAPTGPTSEVWPAKENPWTDHTNDPWPGGAPVNGGRISVPGGGSPDTADGPL